MENFSNVPIGVIGAGLTNQIGYLIIGILRSYRKNKRFVYLQDFNKNFNTDSKVPLGEIIDLPHLNSYLEKYKVHVFDSTHKIDIISIKYGFGFNIFDITEKTINLFTKNNSLIISKDYDLNNINGDPCPGTTKILCIEYKINNQTHTVSYSEKRNHDISFNLKDAELISKCFWIDLFNVEQYNDILSNIKFTKQFYQLSNEFIDEINIDNKTITNVIHIRDDQDAIEFWSKINSMSVRNFATELENKYIKLIDQYFTDGIIIVITSNLNSPVIKYLNQKGYKYFISKKLTGGRETDGIVDLLISKHCNNVFIGNYNNLLYRGSTFSYFVDLCLPKNVKKVMIDLDSVMSPVTLH